MEDDLFALKSSLAAIRELERSQEVLRQKLNAVNSVTAQIPINGLIATPGNNTNTVTARSATAGYLASGVGHSGHSGKTFSSAMVTSAERSELLTLRLQMNAINRLIEKSERTCVSTEEIRAALGMTTFIEELP